MNNHVSALGWNLEVRTSALFPLLPSAAPSASRPHPSPSQPALIVNHCTPLQGNPPVLQNPSHLQSPLSPVPIHHQYKWLKTRACSCQCH